MLKNIIVTLFLLSMLASGTESWANDKKRMPPPDEVVVFIRQSIADNRKNMSLASSFIRSIRSTPDLEFRLQHGFKTYVEYLKLAEHFDTILYESLNYYSVLNRIEFKDNLDVFFLMSVKFFFGTLAPNKVEHIQKNLDGILYIYDEYSVPIKSSSDLISRYLLYFEPLRVRDKKDDNLKELEELQRFLDILTS